MIAGEDLVQLSESARTAIQEAEHRVERAASANDVEAIVGASKDLIETVAKATLDALGNPYGSNASVNNLTSQALEALQLHPSALQGRASLQRLSSSLMTAAQAISELRNTDGTGHGRAAPSNLDRTHAIFIHGAAIAWCRWILATASRALAGRAQLDEAIRDISGARAFSRGRLTAYLGDLRVADLGDDDQRKLGLTVARRWSVNETFIARDDVIEPLANGQADYPPAFREGVFEGLLLDQNGYLRMAVADIPLAISIGKRLPGNRIAGAFSGLADRIEDAEPSQAFDGEARNQAAALVRALAAEQQKPAIRRALERILVRLDVLRRRDPSST